MKSIYMVSLRRTDDESFHDEVHFTTRASAVVYALGLASKFTTYDAQPLTKAQARDQLRTGDMVFYENSSSAVVINQRHLYQSAVVAKAFERNR